MSDENYVQVLEPDYLIHIGIKNGQVCGKSWGEMFAHEKVVTGEDAEQLIKKYLIKAAKGLDETKKRTRTKNKRT